MDPLSNDYVSPFFARKRFWMSVTTFLKHYPTDFKRALQAKFSFNHNCLSKLMDTPDDVLRQMENGDLLTAIKVEHTDTWVEREVRPKQTFSGCDYSGGVGA